MIEINNLTKYYRQNRGCEDVNLKINDGEILGIVGPNGAGKSTIIKCMMNFIKPQFGTVLFDNKRADDETLKATIGYLASENILYKELKVSEQLAYTERFYQDDCQKRIRELVAHFELDLNKHLSELSAGNLKKTAIVCSLMHDPHYIIMDEASGALDPLMQEQLYQLLKAERDQGKAIFYSTHILSEIKKICDRVAVIKEGHIIMQNDVKDFIRSNALKVSVESSNLEWVKGYPIVERQGNSITFMYDGEADYLIKTLNQYSLSRVLIEEASIEEIFMHYYRKEQDHECD